MRLLLRDIDGKARLEMIDNQYYCPPGTIDAVHVTEENYKVQKRLLFSNVRGILSRRIARLKRLEASLDDAWGIDADKS